MEGRDIETIRGDMLPLSITLEDVLDAPESFKKDDVIRFLVFDKKDVDNIHINKDFTIEEDTDELYIEIPAETMEFGEISSKPIEYGYELKLNPDKPTRVTIVGFIKDVGFPILTLLPGSGDDND